MSTIYIRKDGLLVLTDDAEPIALDAGLGTGGDRNGFRTSPEVGAISAPDGFAIDRGPCTAFLGFFRLFRGSLSLEPLSLFSNEHLNPSHQFRLFQHLRKVDLDVVLVEDRFECAD
jgi:hypothetical protein